MKEDQDLFSGNVDYKKVFYRLWSFRNIYITVIIIALAVAFLVNRYSQTKYENSTTIQITSQDNNPLLSSGGNIAMSFGMFDNQKIIDNELEILKSFTLIKKVVNDLDIKVSYFSSGNSPLAGMFLTTPLTRKIEHYNDSPVRVVVDASVPQPVYMIFKITFLNENEFVITSTGGEVPLYNYIDDKVVSYVPEIHFEQRFFFGDEIKTQYFNFTVMRGANFSADFTQNRDLYFYFNNINDLTLNYQANLKTTATSQTSTLIKVTLKGTNREKVTDFLNTLSNAYLERNLNKKNQIALSTVDFIDSQISDVADSLIFAESTLQQFRTAEGVMDLTFQGQQVFEQLSRLEEQKAGLEDQKKYYEYLQDYLRTHSEISDLVAPSAMNVMDPILTNLITTLISLSGERASLLRGSTSQQNLYLADINQQIEQNRRMLEETVNNTLNTLNISINEMNSRIYRANSQISQMPKTELQLRTIERKFNLNDAIYTFLLQKRSEAQIARASSMPDYEVIDPAYLAMSRPVFPKTKLNYVIALFIGLFIPTSVIMMKDFLNNKIVDSSEIEQITQYPVLGRVFHNFRKSKLVVNDHPNSSVTESFRAIRTNFQFFSGGGSKQIILLSSTTSGEGKTFCSMNLASAFALNGSRTILLEFDLRRPKIYQEFTSNNMIGISSYLIDKAILEDIILPTQVENLDFIPAGPAAPNPAELINSERTAELIDKLREMYDYIVIDSAPAGILTETHILMKYSDLNVLVVRLNKTVKEAFLQTLKTVENNDFKNVSLVINDIYIDRESYKYGYDKKYYTDDAHDSIIERIFKRKKK